MQASNLLLVCLSLRESCAHVFIRMYIFLLSVSSKELLLVVIVSLLDSILLGSTLVSANARLQMREVAKGQGVTLLSLYNSRKEDIGSVSV